MGLIDNPAFISAGGNVDTRTGFIFTSDAESPKILSFSCQGDIIVMSTYQGEEVEVTYSNLDHEELGIQADVNTPILIVGNVTEISDIDSLLTIDLRSTRTLLELELSAADLESINLAGCRQMTKLNLSGCSGLQQLDLSQNIRLESLNLSGCSGLQQLDVTMLSELQSLDVSDCTALSYLDLTKNKKITSLNIDGTQLSSPNNTLILASLLGGGSTPEGVAMEATSQEILQKVGTITAIEPDLLAGKEELALQISRKGVASSANDTLMQMASEVHSISQQPITFESSEAYEKQMFGTITTTTTTYQQDGPLWNLYKVMTDLLNDGRFIEYGGILLAEYYKGYDTIELMNVGAGGAYFTSDLHFYTEDKTGDNAHVWNDADNGMANRWVAYLFAAPSTNYTVPSTNLCPRSIHIGRKVGTIICTFAGRISEIVVTDGNELEGTNFSSTQNWESKVIIRNTKNTGDFVFRSPKSVFLSHSIQVLNGQSILGGDAPYLSVYELPNLEVINSGRIFDTRNVSGVLQVKIISMPNLVEINTTDRIYDTYNGTQIPSLVQYYIPKLEVCKSTNEYGFISGTNLIDVWVGAMRTNLKLRGWVPSTAISNGKSSIILDNILHHIAERVSNRTGTTPLTITFDSSIKNLIIAQTPEEGHEYGAVREAFMNKNWNIA